MGSLQLVLRKINRISDTEYKIYNIWCSNLIILDELAEKKQKVRI